MQGSRERRSSPRSAIHCILFVNRLSSRRSPMITVTRSLGLGGCVFPSERRLGIGTLLSLSIVLGRCDARTTAQVVHECPADRGGFEVEVEFLSAASNDRAALKSRLLWSAFLEAHQGA